MHKSVFEERKARLNNQEQGPGLFILTTQSNVTGIRPNLDILRTAKSAGFSTVLDAAALAPTKRLDLAETARGQTIDAVAISFYKMFGYPTGVGALIAHKEFLKTLRRPYFAGGTVDFVQIPGAVVIDAKKIHEQFEVSLSSFRHCHSS